ncbi:MAG: NAD(P)H-dependent oxidoreductase [Verrucomicrobium sp.]
MKRILLIFAHPAPRRSRINRRLLAAVRGMEGVTVHDLYEEYPDFYINVEREQALLTEHDVVLFQHPFYWYSTPALVKQWEDLVLEHGFAYGEKGRALEGKLWLQAITTGGTKDAYCSQGYNRFSVRQLLAPMEQTAHLCRMTFLPPFVVHGTFELQEEELDQQAHHYRQVLEHLQSDSFQLRRTLAQETLNELVPLRTTAAA